MSFDPESNTIIERLINVIMSNGFELVCFLSSIPHQLLYPPLVIFNCECSVMCLFFRMVFIFSCGHVSNL